MGRAEQNFLKPEGSQPFFSIVTVTRNNLPGLRATAASVVTLSTSDYEWIVIDGDSSDGSKAYLQTLTAHWTSEPDRGIYDAMNKGLRQATGDYVIFMNAGDVFASRDVLAEIKVALDYRKIQPDFIYGDAIEDGHPKMARPHRKIASGMFTHHQAMLYRRAALDDIRYDLQYEIAADYDFTARVLQKGGDVFYFPMPICTFEPGGISQQRVTQGRREQSAIRRTLGLCGPLSNALIEWKQSLGWIMRTRAKSVYWYLKGFQFRRRHAA